MITSLCNIYIESELKFDLFKTTFHRVYDVSDNWLINIRGRYREQVQKYIKSNFPKYENKCIFFKDLNDKSWSKSTKKMLECSRYNYVYIFIEDHFLMKSVDDFKVVIQEMMDLKIEYFQYSFFNIGLSTGNIEVFHPDSSNYFYSFQFSEKNLQLLQKNNSNFYPYSLASICSKEYFNKILEIENRFLIKVPKTLQIFQENVFFFYPRNRKFWFLINKFAKKIGFRFVIYPQETPFNLEKSLFDCDLELLPLRIGVLKEEMFANWDDDNKLSNSSLVKRGLYPLFLRNDNYIGSSTIGGDECYLAEGESRTYRYCPDLARVDRLPMKYIFVSRGILVISSERESFTLGAGQFAWIHANIKHEFFANKDCFYYVYIEL